MPCSRSTGGVPLQSDDTGPLRRPGFAIIFQLAEESKRRFGSARGRIVSSSVAAATVAAAVKNWGRAHAGTVRLRLLIYADAPPFAVPCRGPLAVAAILRLSGERQVMQECLL